MTGLPRGERASVPRRCAVCSAPLASRDPRARYCSGRCRVRAHRLRQREERPPLRVVGEISATPAEPPTEERNVEKALVSAVVAGAKHDWRAAAWLLARKYPRRWGRPS